MNHSFTSRPLRTLLQLILFAVFACPATLLAQLPSKFSDKPEDFIKELGDFMTASKRPDLEEAYSVFKKYYKSNQAWWRKIKQIYIIIQIWYKKIYPSSRFSKNVQKINSFYKAVENSWSNTRKNKINWKINFNRK